MNNFVEVREEDRVLAAGIIQRALRFAWKYGPYTDIQTLQRLLEDFGGSRYDS